MPQMPYYFNGGYPNNFQNYQQYQPTQAVPTPHNNIMQNNGNSLNWVQGEAGAKAYPGEPNSSKLLLDSEEPVFYIKTTDASGMPLPLRIFDYTERTQQAPNKAPINPIQTDNFISREEFEQFKEEIKSELKQTNKPIPTRKNVKEE